MLLCILHINTFETSINTLPLNQKTVIIVIIAGVPECYGSFKKFCIAKDLKYQQLLNKGLTPKIGSPARIGEFHVHKVECK